MNKKGTIKKEKLKIIYKTLFLMFYLFLFLFFTINYLSYFYDSFFIKVHILYIIKNKTNSDAFLIFFDCLKNNFDDQAIPYLKKITLLKFFDLINCSFDRHVSSNGYKIIDLINNLVKLKSSRKNIDLKDLIIFFFKIIKKKFMYF